MINQLVECFDYGFVELFDYMGDDKVIEQVVCVSFMGGEDEECMFDQMNGLICYLMRYWYMMFFEMVEFKFWIVSLFFVWQQWFCYWIVIVNQFSGCYLEMLNLFYVFKEEWLCL